MTSRIFTPDQLEEFDVPYTTLHDEQLDSRRWAEVRECVFRAPDDGKTYQVTYQQPLTEHQECDTWFDEEQIKAVEVEQRPVVVQQWKPVDAPAERRTLTPREYTSAWHAVEGAAGEESADPATVLNAVLGALGIDPPPHAVSSRG